MKVVDWSILALRHVLDIMQHWTVLTKVECLRPHSPHAADHLVECKADIFQPAINLCLSKAFSLSSSPAVVAASQGGLAGVATLPAAQLHQPHTL